MEKYLNNINEKRLIQTFIKLVKINSISYHEEKIIQYLLAEFKNLGLKVKFQKVDNTGNIVAVLKGTLEQQAVFFNAHMDTVEPGKNIKPVITDTVIKSDGTTILGSDDKSAIAVFLEGLRIIKEKKVKHPDLYFVITYAEEQGLIGVKNFDFSLLKAKQGYSWDADGRIGTAVLSAPTHYQYVITVHGKAAHAGIAPEKGINAIKLSGALMNKIKTGKIDNETTANIGKIQGGRATNIVPDHVVFEGEVRSRNNVKLKRYLSDLKKTILQFKKQNKVRIDLKLSLAYKAYNFSSNHPLIRRFQSACEVLKIKPVFSQSNGGSDSNIFNQNHFSCLNLGIGMSNVHSTKEYIRKKDLINGVRLFLSLICYG